MNFFSKNTLVLSVATLFASAVWANTSVATPEAVNNQAYTATGTTDAKTAEMLVKLLRNPHLKVKAIANLPNSNAVSSAGNESNPVYVAHGKTDAKTAEMLVKLLRNPHLKVKAIANLPNNNAVNSASNAGNTTSNGPNPVYVAHGKTDAKTAEMLVRLLRNPHLKVKATANLPNNGTANSVAHRNDGSNPVYTAHGKTDRKTAMLLTSLLRNPNLIVKAEVKGMPGQAGQGAKQVYKSFTVSGKTDPKTVKKLKMLFDSSRQVEIDVLPQVKTTKKVVASFTPKVNQLSYQDYSNIIAEKKAFYHNGKPPVFRQGDTIWYPVPVQTASQ